MNFETTITARPSDFETTDYGLIVEQLQKLTKKLLVEELQSFGDDFAKTSWAKHILVSRLANTLHLTKGKTTATIKLCHWTNLVYSSDDGGWYLQSFFLGDKSIIYKSKEDAIRAYNEKRIEWPNRD